MVSLSLVACVFLQLAHAVLHGRLMRVEMFLGAARAAPPGRSRACGNVLFAALGVGSSAAIVLGEWPDLVRAWRTSEFAGVEGHLHDPGLADQAR